VRRRRRGSACVPPRPSGRTGRGREPSPADVITTPRCFSTCAWARSAISRSRVVAASSPRRWLSRVEPTRSVESRVTVPSGRGTVSAAMPGGSCPGAQELYKGIRAGGEVLFPNEPVSERASVEWVMRRSWVSQRPVRWEVSESSSQLLQQRKGDGAATIRDEVLYYPIAKWYPANPLACCSAGKVPGKVSSGARFRDGSGEAVGLCVGWTQHQKPGRETPRCEDC